MGFFRKSRHITAESFRSSGTKEAEPAISNMTKLIGTDFPTTGLVDYSQVFGIDDFVLARSILGATRKQLMGTAALFLAAAENGDGGDSATIATAYLLMANLRPETTGLDTPA